MDEQTLKALYGHIGGDKATGGTYEQWRDYVAKSPETQQQLFSGIGGDKAVGADFATWQSHVFGATSVEKKSPDQTSVVGADVLEMPVSQGGEPSKTVGAQTKPKTALLSKNSGEVYEFDDDQVLTALNFASNKSYGKPFSELSTNEQDDIGARVSKYVSQKYEDVTGADPKYIQFQKENFHNKLMATAAAATAGGIETVVKAAEYPFTATDKARASIELHPEKYAEKFKAETGADMEAVLKSWQDDWLQSDLDARSKGEAPLTEDVAAKYKSLGQMQAQGFLDIMGTTQGTPVASTVFADIAKKASDRDATIRRGFEERISVASGDRKAQLESQYKAYQDSKDGQFATNVARMAEIAGEDEAKFYKEQGTTELLGDLNEYLHGYRGINLFEEYRGLQEGLREEVKKGDVSPAEFAIKQALVGAPVNQRILESTPVQVSKAFGQAGAYLGAGAVGTALRLPPQFTAGMLGGGSMAQMAYEEALGRGASRDEAAEYAANSFIIGQTEGLVTGGFLDRLNGATGGALRRAAKKYISQGALGDVLGKVASAGVAMGTQGTEEAGQEIFSQIMQNMSAKDIWDASRNLGEGVAEGGEIGFIVGALMGAAEGINAKTDQEVEWKNEAIKNLRELTIENGEAMINETTDPVKRISLRMQLDRLKESESTQDEVEQKELVTETPIVAPQSPVDDESKKKVVAAREKALAPLYASLEEKTQTETENDSKAIEGVSSEERIGQEPVEAESEQKGGGEEIAESGVVQSSKQEKEIEVDKNTKAHEITNEQRIRYDESLISNVRAYNRLSPYKKGVSEGKRLLRAINQSSSNLGYAVQQYRTRVSVIKPDGRRLENQKRSISNDEKQYTPLSEKDDTFKRLFESLGLNNETRGDGRVVISDLSTDEIRRGYRDIKSGKKSVAAARVMEAVEDIYRSKSVEYAFGSGGNYYKIGASLDEHLGDIDSDENNNDLYNKIASFDYFFDDNDDIIPEAFDEVEELTLEEFEYNHPKMPIEIYEEFSKEQVKSAHEQGTLNKESGTSKEIGSDKEGSKQASKINGELEEYITTREYDIPFQEKSKGEQAKRLTRKDVDAVVEVMDAFVDATGVDPELFWSNVVITRDGSIIGKKEAIPSTAKGAYTKLPDGKHLIALFDSADATTFIHEFAHMGRQIMSQIAQNDPKWKKAMDTIEEWAGVKAGGKWTTASEEKFARAFEKYVRNNVMPVDAPSALKRAFDHIKSVARTVYKAIKGTKIDVKISPEVAKVFDMMLGLDGATTTDKDYKGRQENEITGESAKEFGEIMPQQRSKIADFDRKHGSGAYNNLRTITANFESILDGLLDEISQRCP